MLKEDLKIQQLLTNVCSRNLPIKIVRLTGFYEIITETKYVHYNTKNADIVIEFYNPDNMLIEREETDLIRYANMYDPSNSNITCGLKGDMLECNHDWTEYLGLNFSDTYCTKCNKIKEQK